MRDLYQSRGRKEWIDFGKGISILLVVLYHVEMIAFRLDDGNIVIFDTGTTVIFSYFRMPFFFFLSGYVFTSDYMRFCLSRKLRQLLRGIVWTYLIFTLLTTVPRHIMDGTPVTEVLKSIMLGYEKWFVVALGVAQLLVALLLSRTKKLRLIAAFMILSVFIGIAIKRTFGSYLPFHIDKVFFVVFFFLAGFFYRIYEERFRKLTSWGGVAFAVALYAALMVVEECVIGGTTANPFWNGRLHGVWMYMLYSITGVVMMVALSKKLYNRRMHLICYIGSNSIVLFYLNVSVIRLWSKFLPAGDTMAYNAALFVLLFLLSTATLFVAIRLIRRYCPILVGDKNSFNHYFPMCKW